MSSELKSVHDAHCCAKHGCKYMDDNCPVVLGVEPGIECEECEADNQSDLGQLLNACRELLAQWDREENKHGTQYDTCTYDRYDLGIATGYGICREELRQLIEKL